MTTSYDNLFRRRLHEAAIISLTLLIVSGTANAWPWTTTADCIKSHVPQAQSDRGANIVRNACNEKYEKKDGNTAWADCVFDGVGEARTDSAAVMLSNLCRKENPDHPARPSINLADELHEWLAADQVADGKRRNAAERICVYRYAGDDAAVNACIKQEMRN